VRLHVVVEVSLVVKSLARFRELAISIDLRTKVSVGSIVPNELFLSSSQDRSLVVLFDSDMTASDADGIVWVVTA
jgi:hypothetical protein